MRTKRTVFGPRRRRSFWKGLSAGAVVLFVLLWAFASSVDLHGAIHPDAGDAEHHCAVTLLAHGQLDVPACEVSIPVPDVRCEPEMQSAPAFSSLPVKFLPPGRAPPLVS